jgi:hypothetical protein
MIPCIFLDHNKTSILMEGLAALKKEKRLFYGIKQP